MGPAGVGPSGKEHELGVDIRLYERIEEGERVRRMHVVVELAVDEEELPHESCGEVDVRLVVVAALTQQALVLLAELGDVAAQVVNTGSCDAGGIYVGTSERVERVDHHAHDTVFGLMVVPEAVSVGQPMGRHRNVPHAGTDVPFAELLGPPVARPQILHGEDPCTACRQ
jgi:hypothetical protein